MIVAKFNELPVDFFANIFFLLQLENVLVELLLQLFVRVINTELFKRVFLEMFKADRFMDLSLSEWVSNTPPELVMQHLGISRETLQAIPKKKPLIMPQ